MPRRSDPTPLDRRDLALAAALAVGFTALAAGLLFLLPRPAVKYDAVEYQLLAESLARGDGFRYYPDHLPTAYRPPLYPALLALVFLISGTSVDAAYGFQALLHGLTVGVVYLLGRHFLPRPFAAGAAVLAGLSTGLTCEIGFLMTETLQTFLVALGALLLLQWSRAWSWRWGAVGGLVWGLAALTKGPNLAILVLSLGVLALLWRPGWRRWLPGVAAIAAVLALTVLPWAVRNALQFGRLVPVSTNIGIQWYVATLDPLTFDRGDPRMMRVVDEAKALGLNEPDTDQLFFRYGLAGFAQAPLAHLKRAGSNALRLWELPPRDALEYLKPTVMFNDVLEYQALVWFHELTLAGALGGLALAVWRRETPLLFLWTVPVALSLVYSPFWPFSRFSAPGLPVLYLSSGYALAALRLPGRFWGRATAAASGGGTVLPEGEGHDELRWTDDAALKAYAQGLAVLDPERPAEHRPWWQRLGLAHLALALALAAATAVFWGTHRPGFTLESAHPYPAGADLVWAVVNPDDRAPSTSAHVARLDLAQDGDRVYLLDQEWKIRDELKAGDLAQGGWTRPLPGRFVIFKLLTDQQGQAWGFRVDGVATVPPDRH